MRVLILGVNGMLGHKLWQVLRPRFDIWGTTRASAKSLERYGVLDQGHILEYVNVENYHSVIQTLALAKPTVVLNCIGVIKQVAAAKDPIPSLTVNALFPHRLYDACRVSDSRLIHISTDCVFSGRTGMYKEDDISDAEDLYGRTKFLGEVTGPDSLTIRTSIIGRELGTSHGLVEWFLGSVGNKVHGYNNAVFSGFPTLTIADIIANIIEDHPTLSGLYHVSSNPIDKYRLLCLVRDAFDVEIDIEPDPTVRIDRSLDSARFRAATGFEPAPWKEMIDAMSNDPFPYDEWRK